jgi:hypothetical protein
LTGAGVGCGDGLGRERGERTGFRRAHGGGMIAGSDRGKDFFPEDRDVTGSLDTDLDHVAFDAGDADLNRVADDDRLVNFAGKDEHGGKLGYAGDLGHLRVFDEGVVRAVA